ncbi:MAG TPA: hypothetical protein DCY35_11800 [Prolixibacteraceae bacterium]|nr:hypothetical protein [Prolixibacteraceae bacterium]
MDDRCYIVHDSANSRFVIRDNCRIGSDSKIIIPVFEAGDYVTIHNHCLVNGYKPCRIGHNTWIGQNCILNVNEELRIGNNVGAGIYSSIWTHGFFGEILEGCNVYKVAPVTIEDDVWILGAYNVIFPGVTLGRKSIIMTGSVVTKDVLPGHCVSGNPAVDITQKITPYRDVTVQEKYTKMKEFVHDFASTRKTVGTKKSDNCWVLSNEQGPYEIHFIPILKNEDIPSDMISLIITENDQTTLQLEKTTIFDMATKVYKKTRTKAEIEFIRFLVSYRARFLPKIIEVGGAEQNA